MLKRIAGQFVSSIITIVLYLILLATFGTWRLLVTFIAFLKFGRKARLAHGYDHLTSFDPIAASVVLVAKIDGKVSREDVLDRLRRKWGFIDSGFGEGLDARRAVWKLMSKVVPFLGYCVYLEDTEFCLDQHVEELLDESHQNTLICSNDSRIQETIEKLVSKSDKLRGEKEQQLWTIHIFYNRQEAVRGSSNGKYGGLKTVLVVDVNHILGDGFATSNVILGAILDPSDSEGDEGGREICSSRFMGGSAAVNRFWLALWKVKGTLLAFYPHLLNAISKNRWDCNPIHDYVMEQPGNKPDDGMKLKIPGNDRAHIRRRVLVASPAFVDLAVLNDIRRQTGVKINSIAKFVFMRATVRFCMKLYPSRKNKGHSIDNHSSSLANQWRFGLHFPVSLWMPNDQISMKNKVSLYARTFPVQDFLPDGDGIVETLKRTSEEDPLLSFKDSVWNTWAHVNITSNLFPRGQWKSFFDPARKTVAATNLRFSEKQRTAFGKKLESLILLTAVTELSNLMASFCSYNGKFALTVCGIHPLFQDREEIEQIRDLAMAEIMEIHRNLTPT